MSKQSDDLIRYVVDGPTISEFVSECAQALEVSKTFAKGGVIDWLDVNAYAKQRVRYSYKDEATLIMGDALIDRWTGTATCEACAA